MEKRVTNANKNLPNSNRALDASHQDLTPSRTNQRHLEPIFIVGQYKCGTTWLLQVLAAHPQVIGVAEIDVVRAACQFPTSKGSYVKGSTIRLASVEDRLHRFFDSSGWCAYYDGSRWYGTDTSAQLERGGDVRTIFGDLAKKPNRSALRKFMNLPSEVATNLYRHIKEAKRPEDAMDAFLEAVCANAEGESHVVLKAADQISVFEVLKAWQPGTKKIVITRDGRDAALSASHFNKLMHKLDAPFAGNLANYLGLLKSWAHRADMVAEWAHQGELYVIRYEDLTRDFGGTLKPLLAWLRLADSDSIIEAINEQTSFEATSGRPRGTEAEHVLRKGAVGEWIDVLSAEDKANAWSLAGEQLSKFGYTQDGQFMPLPEGFMPSPEKQQYQPLTDRIREVVSREDTRITFAPHEPRDKNYEDLIQKLKARNKKLKARNKKLKARGDNLEQQLHSIKNSRSWRLFSPYRRLRAKLASVRVVDRP